MPACFVTGCGTTHRNSTSSSFHKLPANVEISRVWLRALNMCDYNLDKKKKLLVCSHHFTQNSYYSNSAGHKLLKKDAIPNLCTTTPQRSDQPLHDVGNVTPLQITPTNRVPVACRSLFSTQIACGMQTPPNCMTIVTATKRPGEASVGALKRQKTSQMVSIKIQAKPEVSNCGIQTKLSAVHQTTQASYPLYKPLLRSSATQTYSSGCEIATQTTDCISTATSTQTDDPPQLCEADTQTVPSSPRCSTPKRSSEENVAIIDSHSPVSSRSPDHDNSNDVSYQPSFSDSLSSSASSQSHSVTESVSEKEIAFVRKFIVYETHLDELLWRQVCSQCQSPIIDLNKQVIGTLLRCKLLCHNGHITFWTSQNMIGSQPSGNILCAGALLFSGNTYAKLSKFAEFLNLQFISDTSFFKIQSQKLRPVIQQWWCSVQNDAVSDILASEGRTTVSLCGDGRCDSPGYSAKYCTYSMMLQKTGKILTFSTVQSSEASSSVGMEKVGFQRCMENIDFLDIDVSLVATDRHPSIGYLMRTEYPHIEHQYDMWHVAKSLKKKVAAAAKHKDCDPLGAWIPAISNHLWWSAATCDADPNLLKDKFRSVVHHTANIHSWSVSSGFTQCAHDPLSPDDEREIQWLQLGSVAHEKLKKVVNETRFLKDIEKLNLFCHTGQLEVYHNVLNRYCPKLQHFSMTGMEMRTMLAAIDHNMNVDREQATVKRATQTSEVGDERFNVVFPKSKKQWVAKKIYKKKSYSYIMDMLADTISPCSNEDFIMPLEINTNELPSNIAATPRPNKSDCVQNLKSRFK